MAFGLKDPPQKEDFCVLVFSRTKAYRHASIPAGIAAIKALSAASKTSPSRYSFSVHATDNTIVFNPCTLAQYRVIVFLQTSGEFLDNGIQLSALQEFVRNGGGVVGIHCASTGLPSSEWYGRLMGGVFVNHPAAQKGKVVVEDSSEHPTAWGLEIDEGMRQSKKTDKEVSKTAVTEFEWHDEWYNFATNPRDNPGLHVLLSAQETSYEGGTMGTDHPIAWYQDFDGGRSFYTALGHFDEAYSNPTFVAQLHNAIVWTSGLVAAPK